MAKRVIHWFRQDLRLHDNPALHAASSDTILPIYILDTKNPGSHAMGDASKLWLHHSLDALNKSLKGNLSFYMGDPEEILQDLIKRHGIEGIYWNRCYEPWAIERDTKIKKSLGVEVHSFNGSLLWEPWDVLKADKTPYKVFTPFYRKGCLNAPAPRPPLDTPELALVKDPSLSLEELNLLPTKPWGKTLTDHWEIGEAGAQKRLDAFLENGIENYKKGRDFPALESVSRLSPHLHFGEISPNHVWHETLKNREPDRNMDHFLSELGWREFSYNLLYHFPTLPTKNLQVKFDAFPWRKDEGALARWQKGLTGYPIVDAGMRELWETGYMHNRVRMIVGSFLVKNLLLHWHEGERWFWDCLVDADLANNSAGWQWIAGCGADAAPYFRVFNPVTQGQKFDPEGVYIRRFVPELKDLPDEYLFEPWAAPHEVLTTAGVVLGDTYPTPIVDLKPSRERALAAFQSLKKTP